MTKRDSEAIANTLNANVAPLALVLDFADVCQSQNTRFNRALFVKAATHNLVLQQRHEARMLDTALEGN